MGTPEGLSRSGWTEQVPARRRAPRDVTADATAEQVVEVARRQPVAGPDRAQVVRRELISGAEVAGDVQRAAKDQARALVGQRPIADLADGLPGALALSTSSWSSSGSSENAASTPPSERSSVTCFSISTAPRPTAASGTPIPSV